MQCLVVGSADISHKAVYEMVELRKRKKDRDFHILKIVIDEEVVCVDMCHL